MMPSHKGEKARLKLEQVSPKVQSESIVSPPSFVDETTMTTNEGSSSSQSDYQLLNDLSSLALDRTKEFGVNGVNFDIETALQIESLLMSVLSHLKKENDLV